MAHEKLATQSIIEQEALQSNQLVKTPLKEGLVKVENLETSNTTEFDNVWGIQSLQTHYQIMKQAVETAQV